MTLQEPPMTFETAGIGKKTDEDRQKVLPSRNIDYDRMDEMVVDFYLEPTVLQGDRIMQTGRVKLCCPEQRRWYGDLWDRLRWYLYVQTDISDIPYISDTSFDLSSFILHVYSIVQL